MERRKFLKLCAGSIALSNIDIDMFAKNGIEHNKKNINNNARNILKINREILNIKCKKKFSVFHISDTHIARVDSRDNKRKIDLAAARSYTFSYPEYYLNESIHYANDNDMLLIHTGDLIDFVSKANLDYASLIFKNNKFITSAGNHEFSQYVGEAKEDEEYKKQSYDEIQSAYPNPLDFYSYIYNGVNFVSFDNVYYNITESIFESIENEIKKGLPTVLMCHVPLYTEKLCEYNLKLSKGQAAYLCGTPHHVSEKFQNNPSLPKNEQWRNRSVQQRATDVTLEFVKWLKDQRNLKAILCGHTHKFFKDQFSKTAVEIVVGANYLGEANIIDFR